MNETDVKDVFERIMDVAGPPMADRDTVIGAGRRALRRQRLGWATAASASAAALATVGVLALPGLAGLGPAGAGGVEQHVGAQAATASGRASAAPLRPAGSRPWYATRLQDSNTAGVSITGFMVDANVQHSVVALDGQPCDCTVRVYEPGRYIDAAKLRSGQPVQINGRDGYRAELEDPTAAVVTSNSEFDRGQPVGVAVRHVLGWQYASDAWVVVSLGQQVADAPAQLVRIAETAVVDAPVATKMPFRATYLPSGFRAAQADMGVTSRSVALGRGGDLGMSNGMYIGVGWGSGDSEAGPFRPNTTIASHPAQRDKSNLKVDMGGWWLWIMWPDGSLSDSELTSIINGVTPASKLSDRNTWFDLPDALPSSAR